ncbi:MAG: hypothetical protein ABI743_13670, partial [bacterium]
MELNSGLITLRLVTLVAELLLLGLAMLLVLAEFRRTERHHLRPLVIALGVLSLTVGVAGVMREEPAFAPILAVPHVMLILSFLQVLALLYQVSHYTDLFDPLAAGTGQRLTQFGLYGAGILALLLGGLFYLPMF